MSETDLLRGVRDATTRLVTRFGSDGARILIGSLFVIAGVAKILLPSPEVANLISTATPLRASAAAFVADALPGVEVATGLALLLDFARKPAGISAMVLLVVFTAFATHAHLAQITIPKCGCFGAQASGTDSWLHVAIRNFVLATIATATVLGEAGLLTRVARSRGGLPIWGVRTGTRG